MSEIPEPPRASVVHEEQEPADSVGVTCGADYVQVEVNQDFYGTGKLIQSEQLSLGDCPVTGEFSSAQLFVFQSELHGCGSELEISEDELVYTFDLTYTPEDHGVSIFRTSGATVAVSCHYPRQHVVSTDALLPRWLPFAATKTAEDILVFTLRLMTDDWKFERVNNEYNLGSMLHVEASVIQYNHVPLRVFVHSCVATTVPDVRALPRYSFIENHGCLVDAKLTGSRSRFLPRTKEDKLQFELEAFTFAEADDPTIYITCGLVAIAASAYSDHKACSYAADGWTSAEGYDDVCFCCDSNCEDMAPINPVDVSGGDQWEAEAVLEVKVNEAY
uniref:Zona pellucida sperm-binding protein 3 n=1 Tax=Engraulis encrasicolus TaxID=184585 RepID=A0A1B1MRY8_ENGEN|nr:egg envelope protein EeZPCb [Engraulis encrasicolus]